jgi:hypothetical protein
MNKAMENNYLVNNNDISKSTNKKKKKLKMEDDNISNIGNIKYGFCCMNLFDKLIGDWAQSPIPNPQSPKTIT